MDQHPIPQDVTGFQFKLIGTMTVKQFGYVAVGAVMAVILYYLPLSGFFGVMFKVFMIPLLGASGVVIAFVPIDGRPIDTMTSNFIKALFSPNQYIYKRQGRKMSFSIVTVVKPAVAAAQTANKTPGQNATSAKEADDKEAKLRAFLNSSQGRVQNDLDKKEASFLKSFGPPTIAVPNKTPMVTTPLAKPSLAVTQKTVIAKPTATLLVAQPPKPLAQIAVKPTPSNGATKVSPVSTPVGSPAPIPQPQTLEQKELSLAQELAQAKQEEASQVQPAAHDVAHAKVETLAKQIEDIHTQKHKLETELSALKQQLTQEKTTSAPMQAPTPVQPIAVAKPAIPIQDPHLVKVVAGATKAPEVPRVSDTPNVVVGIVKDPRGNILSNILVEVKDSEGNPVRAFKTNPLGQFASATPLSPGVYTLELEDPKKLHSFDVIQITANNEIMRPIEVISHDAREALRQQLFAS